MAMTNKAPVPTGRAVFRRKDREVVDTRAFIGKAPRVRNIKVGGQ
jgi:hypothetical protein